MNNKQTYHYFYKITNLINNHFYYGVHNTNNLDDGYMGSGKRLHLAYKKYGIENFKKEILKYFNTKDEAYQYESEIVTENLIKDINCYNIVTGGKGSFPNECNDPNNIRVRDINGNCFVTTKDDPRWLNGEIVGITKGKTAFKNKITGEIRQFDILMVDKNLWEGITTKKVNVQDNNGNIFNVSIYDERYLSGELKFLWSGRKHSKETIEKIKTTHQKLQLQVGEKNSQYGTCWIHNNIQNKKIRKEELNNYIQLGWIKGRKMKFGESNLQGVGTAC